MYIDPTKLLNNELITLRNFFQIKNFDIRFVGGCVRDLIYGSIPKDIDLCTDATPDEQISIYKKHDVRFIETGLQHGTVSVVINDVVYEITSLRTDVETDGRHAVVSYTRDWIKDLERRDFTFNAMSLDFDGNLLDPFNGMQHLSEGKVKFVGDAKLRLKEDYLRILRWFRFRGRFESEDTIQDEYDRRAISIAAPNLPKISAERIWSEVSKIISGRNGPQMIKDMQYLNVSEHCGIPERIDDWFDIQDIHELTKNPVTLLVSIFGQSTVELLGRMKASKMEVKLAQWLTNSDIKEKSPFSHMAVFDVSREWAIELAVLQKLDNFDRSVLAEWEVPDFPVSGYDLIKLGVKPGTYYSIVIKILKEKWDRSSYTMNKEELLKYVDKSLY